MKFETIKIHDVIRVVMDNVDVVCYVCNVEKGRIYISDIWASDGSSDLNWVMSSYLAINNPISFITNISTLENKCLDNISKFIKTNFPEELM